MNAQAAAQLERDIDAALAHCDLSRAETLADRYRAEAHDTPVNGDPVRSLSFRAGYLAVQVAVAAGRLEQALERATPLLPLLPQLPPELAGRVRLLAAEALARLRRFSEAREQLAGAQAVLRSEALSPIMRMRELRIRLWLGEIGTLDTELSACAAALQAAGDRDNLVLLLCEEGRAWDTHGDLVRAEKCWLRAEQLAQHLAADPIRADVHLQLGRLEHLRGALQAALDRYDAALVGAAAPQQLEVGLRRLLVLLDLNQWEQARSGFASLMRGLRTEQLHEEVRGLAALLAGLFDPSAADSGSPELRGYQSAARGETAAARALYLEALAAAPAPPRQARLALAAGLLALAGGDRNEAARWLKQAEQLALRLDLPEVLWRALQGRGQLAAELEGDDDRARGYFEESVLVSEAQAARLRHRTDAAAYHLHRAGVLRNLLQAACRRGDAARVFHYQELERGRLLWELWCDAPRRSDHSTPHTTPELKSLDCAIEECERQLVPQEDPPAAEVLHRREELLLRRDRLLDDFLRDRSRRGDAALPALPSLAELEQTLPPHTVFIAPSLLEDELHLLVVRAGEGSHLIRARGSAAAVAKVAADFRRCVEAQLDRYRHGFSLGRRERAELDEHLNELGRGPLGTAVAEALRSDRAAAERLIWVPDGVLHGLPIHALRWRGRYLIEDHEVVQAFGGALVVQHARTARSWRRRWRPALVVAEAPSVLPMAVAEAEGVAASFVRSRTLHGSAATWTAIRSQLRDCGLVHFACHAWFDVQHPLAAGISLPSGETWRAVDWLQEPVDGLPLVTLSACRSAEVGALVGREVFGLVTGLLGSGIRGVLAGLWPVADRETLPLMWRFYRHRMLHDPATALALAQRETLAAPAGSPLFWAPFAFFGDPGALPRPGWWRRWWARWRQRRHARCFPISEDQPCLGGPSCR